ncbi:MAG: SGNH/GDSL hydrolase family protein, partial [Elusimicrobiales bacterium]|nr:SGNH/GDSL hydrolase family protein [Elusimicrobiales bacterium]
MKDAPNISRPRSFVYASIAVVLGFAVALSGADLALGWQARRIQAAEKIDPGLLVYDQRLGWRMAADWHGRHRHYDFDVRYSTNPFGLRGAWPRREAGKRRYALLGDSFTFGLGVDDGETFAARLNQETPGAVFLNIGLAGYSTDQQYLYLKDRLAS